MTPIKRTKKIFFVGAVLALAVLAQMTASKSGNGGRGSFALVLIDADGLACSPCLEPLQALSRALPADVQEKRLIGVLTYRDGEKSDPRRGQIARTRWTGYSRANAILFPISVDTAHAFNRLSEEATTILLFDDSTGCVRQWSAPFSPDVLRELAEFLSDVKPARMEFRP
ncbi:MAG: hypothetical protein ACYDH3_01450 [Candidatus Aminicenantales bacterium]